MMAPSRSALFSFSERKTIPLRPAFLHSVSRWRAIMPKGDEEEIAGREGSFRFVALLAPRALLERPTLNPSLIRDQLSADGECSLDRPAQMLGPLPRAACIRESCRGCTSPIQS